jgi:secreted trypsin-like serine protease
MNRALRLLALLPLSLAACVATPPAGAVGQAIINGTVDDGDPNVVLSFAQVPGQSTGSLCTGEVISPHVVLTAAHCVAPDTVGAGAKFIVFTGTMLPATGAPPPDQILQVSETHYVSTFGYNPMTGGDQDDIAVLILAAPTTIAPLPFNQYKIPDSAKGGPARIVGYGITNGNDTQGTTAGTRHEAPTILNNFSAQTLTLFDNMHSNCEGDSGGPTLIVLDGKERIAGITQVGYVHCPVEMGSTDTRVDAYADFVNQWVTMFDPPPVAAGGACTSDADCGVLECLGGLCAQPCDPSAGTTSCPAGTECIDADNKNYCGKPSHHGCAFATRASTTDAGALLLLAALALLARRRRA